jgi:hypothetical protein
MPGWRGRGNDDDDDDDDEAGRCGHRRHRRRRHRRRRHRRRRHRGICFVVVIGRDNVCSS